MPEEVPEGTGTLAAEPGRGDVWVFGYGSLMWAPGFAFLASHHARLAGYHRAFCIHSVHYRGTARRPGLVLGLDRGGACEGIAFRVAAADGLDVLAYLRRREMIYGVYREVVLPVTLLVPGRPSVQAHAFVAERAHPSYAGRLGLPVERRVISAARGVGGTNLDYLANTLAHLGQLGIRERPLERLLTAIGGFAACGGAGAMARPRARSLAASWAGRPGVARPISRQARERFGYRLRLAAGRCLTTG